MTEEIAARFFRYAAQEKALAFVHYSVAAADNLERRTEDVRQLIDLARSRYSELENKVREGAELKELTPQAKLLHYTILTVIERLCVLAETLFASLEIVAADYRKLPSKILRPVPFRKWVRWASEKRLKEIRRLFYFPRPRDIFRSRARKLILRRVAKTALEKISEALGRVSSFYKDYVQVYNKYKHTVSESVGYIEEVETSAGKSFGTAIFLEDYPPPRKKKARHRPSTWGVVVSLETIAFLGNISKDLLAIHKLILVTRLDYLHNQGRAFFPAVGDFLPNPELKEMSSAVEQERNYRSVGRISIRLNLKWSAAVRTRAQQQARRNGGVFKMAGHIFHGPKALKSAVLQT